MAEQSPFVKQLASSDKNIRDKAVASLRAYLGRGAAFDELELRKLWKGLYYCMWLQDKPIDQQQLARTLAGLVNALRPVNFLPFIDAFYQTMSAEWLSIDRLRLDKFMYLIRCYLHAGFEVVRAGEWQDKGLLRNYLDVLQKTPLEPKDPKISNGLRYHMLDIYVDELDKVDSARNAPLDTLLSPIQKLYEQSVTKAIRKNAKEVLQDERLKDWKNRKPDEESDEEHDADDSAADEVEDNGFSGFGD